MKIKFSNTFIKALIVIILVIIIDLLGFAFLVLRTVSIPFVPNRNIDEMSDYYTAVWESRNRYSVDNDRFAIIDITEYSRHQITDILSIVRDMKPKIIGLDVSYIHEENQAEDSLLVSTIQSIPNIVLPVEYSDEEHGVPEFKPGIFHDRLNSKEYGVVSFPDNRDIIRNFRPTFYIDNNSIDAFSCVIAKKCGADISSLNNKRSITINYTTLKLTDDDVIPGFQFLNLNSRDSLALSSAISDKIVLMGSTHLTNDHHLTPLGTSASGIIIHAHVINSLLENKIIRTTPLVLRYILCFVIAVITLCWLKKNKLPQKANFRMWYRPIKWCVLFFISILLFAVIGTIIYSKCSYYIDFSPYIVALILAHFIKDKTINLGKLCKK